MPRFAAKTDRGQQEIVQTLRDLGCYVEPKLSRLGSGIPDLIVMRHGSIFLVELKDGKKPPSKQKLTPEEQVWHTEAKAIGGVDVLIWRSVEDGLEWVKGTR